jgi:hypothetical protein
LDILFKAGSPAKISYRSTNPDDTFKDGPGDWVRAIERKSEDWKIIKTTNRLPDLMDRFEDYPQGEFVEF